MAPLIMLFPYRNDPATGSLIPSMSTGGAAMKAMIKQIAAVSKQGIMMTPNQPTYSLLSVDVTQSQNASQLLRAFNEAVVISIRAMFRLR